MAVIKRIDIGFAGGQILSIRATKDEYDEFVAALGAETRERFHTLKTEDSEVVLDLPQVVYVRRDTEEHKIGF